MTVERDSGVGRNSDKLADHLRSMLHVAVLFLPCLGQRNVQRCKKRDGVWVAAVPGANNPRREGGLRRRILGCCLHRVYAVRVPGSCCHAFAFLPLFSSAPSSGHLTGWEEVCTAKVPDASVSLGASVRKVTGHTHTLELRF